MFSPRPTRDVVQLGVSAEDLPGAAVKYQDTEFAWQRLHAFARLRLYQDDQQELLANLAAERTWISSQLQLPQVGVIPQRFDQASGSMTYRRFLGAGRVVGASLRLGSSSDEVFANSSVYTLAGTGFARLPVRTSDAWLLSLSYANNRTRLNNIPFPGASYQWIPDRQVIVVAGLPAVWVLWKPLPQLAVDGLASIFGTARAGVSWTPLAPDPRLRLRGGWEWGSETFKRADRQERDDQMIIRDMRVVVSLDATPVRPLTLGLKAAWLFEREIFEGKSGKDDEDAALVENGWLFGASLTTRF